MIDSKCPMGQHRQGHLIFAFLCNFEHKFWIITKGFYQTHDNFNWLGPMSQIEKIGYDYVMLKIIAKVAIVFQRN